MFKYIDPFASFAQSAIFTNRHFDQLIKLQYCFALDCENDRFRLTKRSKATSTWTNVLDVPR